MGSGLSSCPLGLSNNLTHRRVVQAEVISNVLHRVSNAMTTDDQADSRESVVHREYEMDNNLLARASGIQILDQHPLGLRAALDLKLEQVRTLPGPAMRADSFAEAAQIFPRPEIR